MKARKASDRICPSVPVPDDGGGTNPFESERLAFDSAVIRKESTDLTGSKGSLQSMENVRI